MAFYITIANNGRRFDAQDGESILSAALRQGVNLPYGCKAGACGACKARIIAGNIVISPHSPAALTQDDRTQGWTLLCSSHAQSDTIVEVNEIRHTREVAPKRFPCRIVSFDRKSDDVIELKLQLANNDKLHYMAGQYVEILLKDGKRRCYSIAKPPGHNGPLELHIRHIQGGLFTDHVFGLMKKGDIVRIEGPFGTFFLRDKPEKPAVLLASGTGFAPIKAIVEHAILERMQRPLVLYWGGKSRKDLYMMQLAEQWENNFPHLRFVPVLSSPDVDDSWSGRTGLVHRAVVDDLPDLTDYQVYACGAPAMVESARREFVQHHRLLETDFFADSFTSAADSAKDSGKRA
jgi:CDP-4-dehydro-6-deoxyglucose reductase